MLLCITCCGTHRSLGRGISKVKSAELDTWDASTLAFMQRLGNARVNGFYEAGLARPGCTWKKPDASAGQTQRALYARKKWGEKMFCFSTVSAGAAVSAQSVCVHVYCAVTGYIIYLRVCRGYPRRCATRTWRRSCGLLGWARM